MTRTRRRSLVLGAVLVALALAAWLLLGDRTREADEADGGTSRSAPSVPEPRLSQAVEDGRRPRRAKEPEEPEEPAARGRGPEAAVAAKALRGVVRDTRGASVVGARVYLVRKGTPGLEHVKDAPNAKTDAEGRFALEADPRGHWVGAVEEEGEGGLLPAHADGDAWDPAAEGVLVMADGGVIEVRVAGMPVDRPVEVYARANPDPLEDPARRRWPAPGTPYRGDGHVRVDAAGTARMRVGGTGPVRVDLYSWAWTSVPESVRLAEPRGRVDFRLVPSARIDRRSTASQAHGSTRRTPRARADAILRES